MRIAKYELELGRIRRNDIQTKSRNIRVIADRFVIEDANNPILNNTPTNKSDETNIKNIRPHSSPERFVIGENSIIMEVTTNPSVMGIARVNIPPINFPITSWYLGTLLAKIIRNVPLSFSPEMAS